MPHVAASRALRRGAKLALPLALAALLLGSLLLAACGEQAGTTETRQPRQAPAGPAGVAPGAGAPYPGEISLGKTPRYVPGDSLGPCWLPLRQIGTAELLGLLHDADQILRADTVFGQFLKLQLSGVGDVSPKLLYRENRHDTVWTVLDIGLEHLPGSQIEQFRLDTINLDRQGRPEVLVTLEMGEQGSGGGSSGRSSTMFDVTAGRAPLLLLQALTGEFERNSIAYAAMHGTTIDEADANTGCKRSIRLRRHEILVGPLETVGRTPPQECTLTHLRAGRYRYQNGRVFRVGK